MDSHPRRLAAISRNTLRLAQAGLLALTASAVCAGSAAANHNDALETIERLNAPNTALGTSYVRNHTSTGHTFDNPGEPDQCTAGSTVNYGATVWYEFHPHVNGRYRVVVSSGTAGFEPVVGVPEFTLGTFNFSFGPCNGSTPPINVATLPASGWISVAGGKHFWIQIGGANEPNLPVADGGVPSTGDYQMTFTYDPNTDGDSFFDSEESCDSEPGLPEDGGCPDVDDDDVIDRADQCRTIKGEARYAGCPDGDGDGNPENPLDPRNDRCPGESPLALGRGDNDDNGCLDYRKLNPRFSLRPGSFFRVVRGRNKLLGIKIERLVVSRLPRGAKVSIKCTRGACRVRPKRVGGSRKVEFKKLRGKKLRTGVKLTIKATLGSSVGEARTYTIKPNDYRTKDFCLRPSGKRGSCSTRR